MTIRPSGARDSPTRSTIPASLTSVIQPLRCPIPSRVLLASPHGDPRAGQRPEVPRRTGRPRRRRRDPRRDRPWDPHQGGARRPSRRRGQPRWRAQRRRARARRRRVHHQQRRLLQLGRRHGAHDPGRRAAELEGRLHPARRSEHRRGVHPLHRVLERAPAGAQRPRVRRARRVLVHRPRRPPRPVERSHRHPLRQGGRLQLRRGHLPARQPQRHRPLAGRDAPLRRRDPHGPGVLVGALRAGRGRARQPRRQRGPPARRACPACSCSTAWPSTARGGCASARW